jgi:hypothetical protein
MVQANWQSDQPTNLNYLSPVNFDLLINKLPKTRYNCIGATLPGVTFNEAIHSTPLSIQSYLPGDRITFDPLLVRFAVDEDMGNYKEIYDWIMQLGPGMDTDDYRDLVGATKSQTGFDNRSGDMSKMYSDATLVVNTSSNNPNLEFTFEDCFPTSLGAVEFATDASEVTYAVTDLTLRYTLFKMRTST